jgi:hypothetical protein
MEAGVGVWWWKLEMEAGELMKNLSLDSNPDGIYTKKMCSLRVRTYSKPTVFT